jgi:hypothetical protein
LFTSCDGYFSADLKSFLSHSSKHAFSYNTVFNSFFEEKSNIFMLGYRSAEKTRVEALWRREENCPGNLKSINSGGNRTLPGGQGFLFRRGRGREMNRAEG